MGGATANIRDMAQAGTCCAERWAPELGHTPCASPEAEPFAARRVRFLDAHRYALAVSEDRAGPGGVVIFAGGGTGGHIYPNVAIAEQLASRMPELRLHFWVSDRPGDAKIMERLPYSWSASPVQALPPLSKPWRAFAFLRRWSAAKRQFGAFLQKERVLALVTSGGFVSGPAMIGAHARALPRAMVNLDAVPGKANRRLQRYAQASFTVYPHASLDNAQTIGLPLRKQSRAPGDSAFCRERLGLDPQLPTLMVTGATHGATSIIESMMLLAKEESFKKSMQGWQLLHQCGSYDEQKLQAAYDAQGVNAKVVSFIQDMGAAWGASDVVVSRSGAGSVAEAWGNAVPTIFMPNPYHADGHQRVNCEPMIKAKAALEVQDLKEAQANLSKLKEALESLLQDSKARDEMRLASRASCPGDGAQTVAAWVCERLHSAED